MAPGPTPSFCPGTSTTSFLACSARWGGGLLLVRGPERGYRGIGLAAVSSGLGLAATAN
ncbi:MAG: hypothetical protein AVDCRST_MAG22-3326 [uncultured Rubrobacteraceae bacterium]|uniref:Uncharacterized protein n=1 Tax=uncultured Rubrobacteraceae bacterium TaxID=349277 RepID=A0A6J4Q8R0_9ACTN|nr:MAG: hypothetical protein AVDCRST_MAG22-3326 [uncultured Rubrobacteraceae bacterium]